MGSHAEIEFCEVARLYLLNQLSTVVDENNVEFYRYDRLVGINIENGPKLDRITKNIIKLFKEEGISITIKRNLIEKDFLDVPFNLATKKHFYFERLTIHKSKPTPFLITRLQSSNSCLK